MENIDTVKTLERLKECMQKNDDNMSSLAKKLGISRTTTLRWMRGEVGSMKSTTVSQIARLYGVSPMWLLGYDVPKYPETESHANKRNIISDMLINVKESDLDRLLVIVKAFVDTAKVEEENERNEKAEKRSKEKEGGANKSK